ncbi:GTP-BINDING NUCLEAR PROTEIN [Encephalitozoon cuniculi GB-M1]|uniref:GTP-binding nuclear protein GSP1 n=2 Tax=Encephalitozoon cuniculi TaxID=6035 RepID=GSP1_ENCCU|nr:GTP-binding nuclear protein [Encephalitozoon cuniculi GB-M1]Q8SS11.1 RecName: Full=GTP-binding nuclear protein GSP1; AltName: Full=GTPase Ran homolog [Encephalitozoon cuniculi GB-M1]AGE95299.1 GTP-binding nuclear protein [Encephalitozoon cuniculi]KMV66361.1 GTP-binding nuclear protein [Encephalitozoon cuniculi EcunIII-L]UYI27543.1 GTP-binding nuclear protein Ran [Encephalitozoon cuniculi]CAD25345.1 GTP-BINDING NUCLEAR PROTEIN [Encephalitozoon cuniculi GB-M1]
MERRELTYKICLIGDGGVGKTTYINRVLDGRFEKNYNATVGAVNHPVTFLDDQGNVIKFNVWDTAGQEKKAVLKDVYYIGASGAIFFFDVTSRITCQNLARWVKEFQAVVGNEAPIVVCANKIDIKNRQKISKKLVMEVLKGKNYEYFEISAKTAHNFGLPFLHLARIFTGRPDLIFVSNVNLEPTEVNYDYHSPEESKYIDYMEQASKMAPEE